MKKTVLITGATSGIGLGCARKFAANGDRLILTGRNEQRLEEIRKELTAKGTEVLTLVFDVRDREKATECINNLPAEWKDIDVLVNNAGLALGLEPEYEGSYDDWDTMVDTNIKGLLTMTRLVVPGMVKRDRGHIINIGSVAGDAAYANGNVYCATKAAVKTITDGLRLDVANTAIDEDGIAKEHSLRRTEVVVPCIMYGEILDVPESLASELEKAMGFVKRIGQNRNRGLGRCTMSVIKEGGEQ